MKEYEVYSTLKVPKNSKIILRLDGRSFHSLTRFLNLNLPYDESFYNILSMVCRDLFVEFSPLFIYSFSDEISILFDKIPFNGRLEKLNSVIPSFASSSFTIHLNKKVNKPVAFDCRVIPISDADILKYFKWRQDEAWSNCINSYGIWMLRSKYSNTEANDKINGLKSSQIHELLFQYGVNLNDVDNYKKRGIGIYRDKKEIHGFNKKKNINQTSYRNYIKIDWNLPKFSEKFFKGIL